MASKSLTTQTNAPSNKVVLINEQVTGPPAEALLERCGLLEPPGDGTSLRLLDNASGPGTLIFRLLKRNPALHFDKIVGGDIDESYLAFMRERAAAAQASNIEALRLDQQSTGLEDNEFDYVFNNFGVFFAPNDSAVLTETLRILKPHGTAGFTTWNKISWWDEILLPALARCLPDAPPLPNPGGAFPTKGWNDPEAAKAKLEDVGFVDIHVEVFSFTPDVQPEDFAMACAHLVKAMTMRAWDEPTRSKFNSQIEKALLDQLCASYEGGRWTGKMAAVLTWGKKA